MLKYSLCKNWLQQTVVFCTPGIFRAKLVLGFFHETFSTYAQCQSFEIHISIVSNAIQTSQCWGSAISWMKGTLILHKTGSVTDWWWRQIPYYAALQPDEVMQAQIVLQNVRGHCYNENIPVKQAGLEKIHISVWGPHHRGVMIRR